jgi:hypothetical protein
MSFGSMRVLDGYQLNASSNSFVTQWLDLHSSPFYSISVVFSSASVTGTLTLECSNDREGVFTDGTVYPKSAQFTGAYGVGPLGDPIDLITVPSSSTAVAAAGPFLFNSATLAGYRWVRAKYVASGSVASTVTVTHSRKSSS